MTIYRRINYKGEIVNYRVRVERKETGIMNKLFASEEEAREWLAAFDLAHPGHRASWWNRPISIRDEGTNKTKKYVPRPAARMSINGCTAEKSGIGTRCKNAYHCPQYYACLDAAARRNWGGWQVV